MTVPPLSIDTRVQCTASYWIERPGRDQLIITMGTEVVVAAEPHWANDTSSYTEVWVATSGGAILDTIKVQTDDLRPLP